MGDQKRGETDRGEGERISEKNRELGGGGGGGGGGRIYSFMQYSFKF